VGEAGYLAIEGDHTIASFDHDGAEGLRDTATMS
jgi:hypothetical protein